MEKGSNAAMNRLSASLNLLDWGRVARHLRWCHWHDSAFVPKSEPQRFRQRVFETLAERFLDWMFPDSVLLARHRRATCLSPI